MSVKVKFGLITKKLKRIFKRAENKSFSKMPALYLTFYYISENMSKCVKL